MKAPNRVPAEDQLVTHLVPDPANVPNVNVHVGMIGKSNREGYWRIYTTPKLNDFIEIHEDDIVHLEPLSSSGGTSLGTAAWVKAEATIARTRIGPQQSQAES